MKNEKFGTIIAYYLAFCHLVQNTLTHTEDTHTAKSGVTDFIHKCSNTNCYEKKIAKIK